MLLQKVYKNKIHLPLLLSVLSLTVIFFAACQKEVADNDTTSAKDVLMIEREDNNVMNAVASVLRDSGSYKTEVYSIVPNCATVAIPDSSSKTSKTLIIDFGSTGCANTDWDGKTRSGKLIAIWTGNYFKYGTVINISSYSYTVGGYAYSIAQTLTCMGPDANNNIAYQIVSKDNISSGGTTASWNTTRLRTWMDNGSISALDDTYKITGTGTGTDRTGTAFNYVIADTLTFDEACVAKKLVSGNITMNVQGKAQRVINIGSGNCTDPVQVNIAGNNYTLTLN